jgi:broad specificity phosphatase PhoE
LPAGLNPGQRWYAAGIMKYLYIIRHGETVWNAEQRMQGRLDSPLNDRGREQARQHAQTLARMGGVDFILSSPSGRTRETTSILNQWLDVPSDFDEALMERDCGLWSGFTIDEIAEAYPEEWAARDVDPFFHRPPDGENLPDLIARVGRCLTALHTLPHERVALVTHGVMSRAILTHYLQLPVPEANRVRHPNDLFYRLRFEADAPSPEFFRAGQGPVAGLLQARPGETIPVTQTSSD